MRLILGVISLLLGFCIFIFLAFLGALMYFNAPPAGAVIEGEGIVRETDGTILFEVRRGESARSVGRRLEEAGIIRSRYFWYVLTRIKNEFVKSGTYSLDIPVSQISIHQTLVSGRHLLKRVTVPEGVTLKKTARIFEDSGVCIAEDFLRAAEDGEILTAYGIPGNTMEGYLFPDTYLFPDGYPADLVIRAMADNFFDRLGQIEPDFINMSPAEINRRVIIASIVEREYRMESEAPLMAGVFYNRLDIGMALQSCATVEYVITETQGRPHPEILYTRDTEIRNPYNT
jgi:UPF0755 protein